jgi:arylsulfatase
VSGRSTLAVIDAEIEKDAEGVLFAIGGVSSGFTVYMDKGILKAEYNAMTMNRYKVVSNAAIPTGKVKIEVETVFDSQERMAPATVTLRVNGKQVGQGRVERSVPGTFTASETFDVGKDLGSPVALDYYERAPFEFKGRIAKIHIRYL